MDKIINLIQGDITTQDTDAIVNAANSSLAGGGGVDGAIHRAGGPVILEECQQWVSANGKLPTGQAMITTAGNMPTKYVIHTVGPVWHGGSKNEPQLLANAWHNSLSLVTKKELKTISFPSISTGVYRFPIDLAAEIAIKTCKDFLKSNILDEIRIVLFSEADLTTYKQAYAKL